MSRKRREPGDGGRDNGLFCHQTPLSELGSTSSVRRRRVVGGTENFFHLSLKDYYRSGNDDGNDDDNDDDSTNEQSIESVLAVPMEILFRKAVQTPQSESKPLLTKAEADCFLRISFLSHELDVLTQVAERLFSQQGRCRRIVRDLTPTNHPYLRALVPILSYLEKDPKRKLRRIHEGVTQILSELMICASNLRQSAEQNWILADSLTDALGGLNGLSGDVSGKSLATEKRKLADLEEEVAIRIESILAMKPGSTASAAAGAATASTLTSPDRRKVDRNRGVSPRISTRTYLKESRQGTDTAKFCMDENTIPMEELSFKIFQYDHTAANDDTPKAGGARHGDIDDNKGNENGNQSQNHGGDMDIDDVHNNFGNQKSEDDNKDNDVAAKVDHDDDGKNIDCNDDHDGRGDEEDHNKNENERKIDSCNDTNEEINHDDDDDYDDEKGMVGKEKFEYTIPPVRTQPEYLPVDSLPSSQESESRSTSSAAEALTTMAEGMKNG